MISTVSYVKVTLHHFKFPLDCIENHTSVHGHCSLLQLRNRRIVAPLSFLPLRADLERLPSPLVPWAVVPNLYLHPVFSPSPTHGFSLHYLRTAMSDGILVSQGSCCLSTFFFPPPPLGGRPWLPTGSTALAGRLQIGHAVSLAETSGLTLRHWDIENVSGSSHKLRHPHDVFLANQIVKLYITFVLRKVFKLLHIM